VDESDVLFFGLTREWYDLLCSIDPIISKNLWVTSLYPELQLFDPD
jgi:hypothetical protein